MKRFLIIATLMATLIPTRVDAQPQVIDYAPSATYFFAQKEGVDLYMDVYDPAPESETTFEGHTKPTILWLFGGGFIIGERSAPNYLSWFKLMNDNGYRVITADYRKSLEGEKLGFGPFDVIPTSKKFVHASCEIGVQDCFSAVNYILENSETLGVDPKGIVVSGSSAGALIAVTAEWELVNRMPNASVLPADFNFAGVMCFSGGIMTDKGAPKWAGEPCPQLFFHGTSDKLVNYNKVQLFKIGIFGSSALVERLKKQGYQYNIVRVENRGHDIAESMIFYWQQEKQWLEQNVMLGIKRTTDETINDPSQPGWWDASVKVLSEVSE